MRIGFFGGSFDPPHRGHLAVARAAAKDFSLDKVLLAPTGRQPFKADGAKAPFEDRLAMVALLCDDLSESAQVRLESSALDAPRADGSPNYTIDALDALKARSNRYQLFLIVGIDAFLGVRQWKSSDRLFELGEWIVVSRPGFALEDVRSLQLSPDEVSRVHFLERIHEEASATNLRELLAAGSDCAGMIPPSVLAYIYRHHLYGT